MSILLKAILNQCIDLEWFYQYKGDMLLKVHDDNKFQDIIIKQGETLLLPAGIPHNPCRYEDTVGLVIERKRPLDSLDQLRWYCESCSEIVYNKSFYCTNLGIQLKPVIEKVAMDSTLRTCKSCGHVNKE